MRPGDAAAQGKRVKLAYCSQLLCGVPYEVARSSRLFKIHGLDVELVYTRGGSAAMQALIGGAVDYAATSLDVALTAYANVGADIRRFAVTGRLPLFALVTAPKTAEPDPVSEGARRQDRRGLRARQCRPRADAVSAQAGRRRRAARSSSPPWASISSRLCGSARSMPALVQEPALTLLSNSGARVLVNAMDLADAQKYLGGTYEFMGVAVRGKEIAQRKPEMLLLTKALADALKLLHTMSGDQLVAALPKEMTTGLDLKQFGDILARYRDQLYPGSVTIDLDAAKRVAQSLIVGGLLKPDADISGPHDTTIVGG